MPFQEADMDTEDLLDKIEQHDRFQFEAKLEYPLNTDASEQTFVVETYLFLPHSLNVNGLTYPPQAFYGDVVDHVRFKTPSMTLGQIIDPRNALSPLARIEGLTREMDATRDRAEHGRRVIYESRMLGCILRVTLRDLGVFIEQRLSSGTALDRADVERLVRESEDHLRELLRRYRDAGFVLMGPSAPRELANRVRLVDEFLSLSAESFALHVLEDLPEDMDETRSRMARLAREEIAFREGRGYRSVVRPTGGNEEFVHRHALLKKYVAGALYLGLQHQSARAPAEHFFFALAAGIAMAFATAVSFLATQYASISWTLFAVLVVSYMAKDRIKEGFRYLFSRWLDQRVADYDVAITDPATGGVIGRFRQKVRFLGTEAIPADVRGARDLGRADFLSEGAFREHVLCYRKTLRLFPRKVAAHHTRVNGITDILRFNIRRLLHSMDEPEARIRTIDPVENRAVYRPARKTYHVNAVMKVQMEGAQVDPLLRRLRIVLSRDGIDHIEPIALQPDRSPKESFLL